MVRGVHDGANVVFLEVPGFNQGVISNESVVKMFAQCLKAMYVDILSNSGPIPIYPTGREEDYA
jgi:hypothetical protein